MGIAAINEYDPKIANSPSKSENSRTGFSGNKNICRLAEGMYIGSGHYALLFSNDNN